MVRATELRWLRWALLGAGLLAPARAWAHQNGIAADACTGCHGGGVTPQVTLTASSAAVGTGQMVILTVTIAAVNGPVGGLYLRSNQKGTFTLIAGEGTRAIGSGVTHTAPKRAAGGLVTFHVGWTAPATPGGVDFDVSALSGNGDGTSRGDSGGSAFLSFAYGCSGTTFYRDFDGDGVGAMGSGTTVDCARPDGYSLAAGDCDDNDQRVFPGAVETCNGRDDDCNGRIDEGLAIATFYTDADGDGHGAPSGATVVGCGPPRGYGVGNDDCDDGDPNVYPGAQELCDDRDNNCNGQIDENARLVCGVGWCRRLGAGCGSNDCTPGKPNPEACNDFDDDCDGVIDNGANLCGAGAACVAGYCIGPDGGAASTDGGAGGGAGATGGLACAVAGAGGEAGLEGRLAIWSLLALAARCRLRRRRGRRAGDAGR